MPATSVIMPNWNKGRYIATAIQSVLQQSESDFELIVVDDSSSDESLSILERIAKTDSRMRLIVNESNRGPSYCRNVGMKKALGKYLCFVDSDDILMPERTRKMKEVLDGNKQLIVFTDIFTIDEDGRLLRGSHAGRLPSEGNAYSSVLTCQLQGQSTMMMPASAIEDVGFFDESMRWGEDFEFLLRLVQKYEVALVQEPLYGYRRHRLSTSVMTDNKRKGEAYIKVLESNLQKNGGELDDATRFSVIRRIQYIARESHLTTKYLRWETSPTYLGLLLSRVGKRLRV